MKITQWVFVACALIIMTQKINAKEDRAWSFADHPQPGLYEMTEREKLVFSGVKKRSQNDYKSCRASLQAEYEIYLNRYPEYYYAYDKEDRFKQWKLHMAQNPTVQEITCLYGAIEYRLYELHSSDKIGEDFYFCNGFYTREPRTNEEREVVVLMSELLEYAHLGLEEAALKFGSAKIYGNVVRTSLDLKYYFYGLANSRTRSEILSSGLFRMALFLPAERQALLDIAIATHDYQSVVETSPNCRP